MTQLEKIAFFGWPNCYRLFNNDLELIVTTDVGPRVVWCGFIDRPNHLAEFPSDHGQTGGDQFRMYGGHRFWLAPEGVPRSYYPDNNPVALEDHSDFIRLIAPVETSTGLQKVIDLQLAPEAPRVRVTHRLRNHNVWAVEVAPWALSVMAPGGVAIIPLPARAPHSAETLLPNSHLVLWPYTDLADPRWRFDTRYIRLRQDPTQTAYQKLGVYAPDGWVAYANHGELFIKTFTVDQATTYPDRNSPLTAFVNAEFLELETLGPLARLAPGAVVEHVEKWGLVREVPAPSTEAEVEAFVAPQARNLILAGRVQSPRG